VSTGPEMNESREFITCCPACNTSFRVTLEQMEMASGAVRCGACLRIFQANEQMVEDHEAADVEDSQSDPPECGIDEIHAKYWQDFDLYIEEIFTTLQSPKEADHAEESQPYRDGSFNADLSEDDLSKDDLSEDREVSLDSERQDLVLTEMVSRLDLEDDPENLVGKQVAQLDTHPAWFVALPVLVISGFLQFAWFNHGVYAQQAEYRPWYLIVCSWIGCELPEYSNKADLSTSNLIVRSHPDVEGALIIDAIVRNSARYRQRFPFLQLQFQDIDGNPVAQRRFNPENYLAGELRGLRFIPGNTEVRFSLEIVDPGKNALGYNLEMIQGSP